jgi:peptide/nickel transport system permease protein
MFFMKKCVTPLENFISWAKNNQINFWGLVILVALVFIAVLAPIISPYDPLNTGTPFQYPSLTHILGTDDLGHDIFSQVIYGTRVSLFIGFIAASVTILIGVSIGLLSGYYRGWLEELLMGLTDVYLLIPGLPLMIFLSAYLSQSIWNIIIVIGLLWWCSTARIVHARVLQIREMDYIKSTKMLGYPNHYIMIKHVLVNTKEVIFAKYSLAVASAMLSEASLSFIGLGDPSNLSWGEIISFAFSRGGFAKNLWWWYIIPGLMICISVLAFLLIATKNKTENNKLIEV